MSEVAMKLKNIRLFFRQSRIVMPSIATLSTIFLLPLPEYSKTTPDNSLPKVSANKENEQRKTPITTI